MPIGIFDRRAQQTSPPTGLTLNTRLAGDEAKEATFGDSVAGRRAAVFRPDATATELNSKPSTILTVRKMI
jgi:hypothetical protein